MSSTKYSDWLRIDLHIHTDLSRKTKDNDYKGSFSVPTLKEKLNENNVEIFSLTDHNIINVDAYKEYYESFSEGDPLLFLGVEFDILVESSDVNKTYHSLIIFNHHTFEKANEISDRIEDKYDERGFDDKTRILTIDEIIELFPDDEFFFFFFAGNTQSIVSPYRRDIEYAQKMVLLMPSAFEKVKEKARQKYNEGFNRVLRTDFQDRNDIPYIDFSDNHNIEQYPCVHTGEDSKIHDFYYIKGGKNFETLRLAFIDPESRIKSPQSYRAINHSLNSIEKLKIETGDFLCDNQITFSPHMNVIIGGRSSGKSLLFNIIGRKIDKVIAEEKYGFEEENITIKSKRDSALQDVTSLSDELIYLNQGDIVKYFENKKLNEFAKDSNIQDKYDNAENSFKEHKNILQNKIDSVTAAYKKAYELGEASQFILHNYTIEKVLSEEYIIKSNTGLLENSNEYFKKIKGGDETFQSIEDYLNEVKEMEIIEFSDLDMDVITRFEDLIKSKRISLSKKKKNCQKRINFLTNVRDLIQEKNQSLSLESRQKEEATRAFDQLLKEIGNKFSVLKTLRNRCRELETFNYEKRIKIPVNEDLSIYLEIEKKEELKQTIIDGFNDGDNAKSLYLNLYPLIKNRTGIKNYNESDHETLSKKIYKLLEDIFERMYSPKDYLEYKDGSTSKDNSPGFNSEKYLEIILKNSKNKFIFIDQPEDNLGNKFITEKLVSIFRELKFQKQIFLVTHNPSIVVYGDAENVIIAENKDNEISYRQIVLENQEAQKEICSILDGGEYIFDIRSKKYNIKRILKEAAASG